MSWKLTAYGLVSAALGLWGLVLLQSPAPGGKGSLLSLGRKALAHATPGHDHHKAHPNSERHAPARPLARRKKAPKPGPLLIRNATVWTATGQVFKQSDILVKRGRIAAIGRALHAPKGARVIEAKGRIVTPGLIDTHSHMGVYPSVGLRATADGNESGRSVTAYAWAEHAIWTQDPAFPKAVAGGATTVQVLPGSANLIGGRGVTIKLKLSRGVHQMKFPGAMHGLKMACGENPKRVHRSIRTRMGSYAGYRRAFLKAVAYQKKWRKYEKALKRYHKEKKARAAKAAKAKAAKAKAAKADPKSAKAPRNAVKPKKTKKPKKQKKLKKPRKPRRDINLDTLKLALEGKILVHIHCYRAEEMIWMMRLSKEFGFKIRSFHHAVEAYKIRDMLAKERISVSTWADWWGFKLEAFDGIQENAAMVHNAGGITIIHSDSAIGVQRLNHEAGKALYRGRAMGLKISDQEALQWITKNAAWGLGILKQTGTIEVGKMADLVIWDGHPFKVYTRTAMVFIDGELVFDRRWPPVKTDFELGLFLR